MRDEKELSDHLNEIYWKSIITRHSEIDDEILRHKLFFESSAFDMESHVLEHQKRSINKFSKINSVNQIDCKFKNEKYNNNNIEIRRINNSGFFIPINTAKKFVTDTEMLIDVDSFKNIFKRLKEAENKFLELTNYDTTTENNEINNNKKENIYFNTFNIEDRNNDNKNHNNNNYDNDDNWFKYNIDNKNEIESNANKHLTSYSTFSNEISNFYSYKKIDCSNNIYRADIKNNCTNDIKNNTQKDILPINEILNFQNLTINKLKTNQDKFKINKICIDNLKIGNLKIDKLSGFNSIPVYFYKNQTLNIAKINYKNNLNTNNITFNNNNDYNNKNHDINNFKSLNANKYDIENSSLKLCNFKSSQFKISKIKSHDLTKINKMIKPYNTSENEHLKQNKFCFINDNDSSHLYNIENEIKYTLSPYTILIENIYKNVDLRTTCMLKNIPNKYTQKMLIELLNESHFGTFDFLYLRMDFNNECNVGYAFVNFIDPLVVASFFKKVNGKGWKKYSSSKIAELTYASIQGVNNLVFKFRKSRVMDEHKSFRPKLFYTQGPFKGLEKPNFEI
ncbi:Protein MEI2-like 1 [Dictyocoela muelleri]|nr:Protein MEI2-like 1 [Dictyocoela muelleri]